MCVFLRHELQRSILMIVNRHHCLWSNLCRKEMHFSCEELRKNEHVLLFRCICSVLSALPSRSMTQQTYGTSDQATYDKYKEYRLDMLQRTPFIWWNSVTNRALPFHIFRHGPWSTATIKLLRQSLFPPHPPHQPLYPPRWNIYKVLFPIWRFKTRVKRPVVVR